MALRLAGEPAGVVRGLDGVGWLREMTAGDAQAGLKVDQLGVGRVVDFKDGGASKFSVLDGGRVAVADSVEFGAAPASSGVVRWSNNSVMKARNAANSADLDLARLDSSDVLALGGAGVTGLTIGYTGGALALVSVYPALAVAGASQATAVSGTYRGPNAVTLMGRNAANSADVALAHLDASNDVQIGGEGAGKAAAAIILGTSAVVNDVACRWRLDALNGIKNSGGNYGGAVKFLEGVSYPYSGKSLDYTATTNDHVIAVDASGGPVTVTLPPAATAGAGFSLVVKKVDNNGNTVTVDGDGTETIDGAGTHALAAQWRYVQVISDGTNWVVTANN